MSWDGAGNFTAYDDVESFDNYASAAEIDAYRSERLRRYAPHVAFVRSLGEPADGLRVLEIGAGSSAFLYALEQGGLLAEGLAVELSASRHAFAERWRSDGGFERVTNVRADFATFEPPPERFDRVVVLDDTYLCLRPESEAYPRALFELALRALRPGGALVLDVRNDAPLARGLDAAGREFRVDLPETNAFAHAVYRQVPSPDGRRLRNDSTYVPRGGGEPRRKVEVTEVVDPQELRALLEQAGFDPVELYGTLERDPFDPERSPRLVVTASRPGRPS